MKDKSLLIVLGLLCGTLFLLVLPWMVDPTSLGENALPVVIAAPQVEEMQLQKITAPFSQNMASILCTLAYTDTDKAPTNNHTFGSSTTAASISNYTGQVLVYGTDDQFYEGNSLPTQPDFYRLDNPTLEYQYTVKAVPDRTSNYDLGIIAYDKNWVPIITDTNSFDGNSASVTIRATDYGPYFFQIFQRETSCSGGTYSLILTYQTPTSTPTPTGTTTATPTKTPKPAATATPAPTWMSGYDKFEPNFNFDTAKIVAPDITYDLNFIPWGGGSEVDNDYFKLWVKPGLFFSCETHDLAPGVDTNMILYDSGGNLIMGNDDKELGEYSSRVSYTSNFEGFLYLLVGHGSRLSYQDSINSGYQLTCSKSVPGAEPGTGPGADKGGTPMPTATPRPSSSSPLPTPETPATTEPSGTVELTFRPMTTPAPTTPTPTPGGFRTFRMVIFYDSNADQQFGAGEGVPGFYVRVLDAASSEELAHGYTDEQGQLSFTVPTVGTVRAIVPLLGVDRSVEPSLPELKIRIAPQPLPAVIP